MVINLFIAAIAFLIVLCLSVPRKCWAAVRANCYRSSGRFSRRRFSREVRALVDYASMVAIPVLLVGLGLFVASTFVFSHVIPMELLADCISAFDMDSDIWRENLVQVQADHELFLRAKGASVEDVQKTQSALWDSWPLVAAVVVAFVVGFFILLFKCTARSIVILAAGIRHRRDDYARIDVTRKRSMAKEALV